ATSAHRGASAVFPTIIVGNLAMSAHRGASAVFLTIIVGNLATSAHRGASAVFPTIVVGDAPSGVSRHARPYRPREVAASHGRADPIIDVVGALVSSKGSSESIQPRSHAASSE